MTDAIDKIRKNEEEIDAAIARKKRGEPEPFDMVCEMEEPLLDIRDYAAALSMMAEGLDRPASGAVGRIARSIEETVESIEEWRGKLFHALHPRRGEPGFTDYDKEAEGNHHDPHRHSQSPLERRSPHRHSLNLGNRHGYLHNTLHTG